MTVAVMALDDADSVVVIATLPASLPPPELMPSAPPARASVEPQLKPYLVSNTKDESHPIWGDDNCKDLPSKPEDESAEHYEWQTVRNKLMTVYPTSFTRTSHDGAH